MEKERKKERKKEGKKERVTRFWREKYKNV